MLVVDENNDVDVVDWFDFFDDDFVEIMFGFIVIEAFNIAEVNNAGFVNGIVFNDVFDVDNSKI